MERLYSTTSAAKTLDVNPNEVRRLIKCGRLAAIKFRGARAKTKPSYRIPESSLKSFLNELTNPEGQKTDTTPPRKKKVRGELVTRYY